MIGWGADADELERLAALIGHEADKLENRRATLNISVHHAPWHGPEADTFRHDWDTHHVRAMHNAVVYLRAANSTLAKSAHEQRVASAAEGGAMAHRAYLSLRAGLTPASLDVLATIVAGLAGQLAAMRGRSAADQLAWWNSLTPDQRRALLIMRPGELTALAGLPPDVLAQARDEYLSTIADQVKVGSISVHGEAAVDFKVVKVGAELDAEMTVFRDGHVEIDMSAALTEGVSADVADLAAKEGVSGVYRFANQQEANAFLEHLRNEIKPSAGELLMYGTSAPAASIVGYLVSQRGHLDSVTVSGGGTVSADAKGTGASAKIEAEGKLSTTVQLQDNASGAHKGDITLKASESVSARETLGTVGAQGKIEMSAALTMRGDHPQSLTFTQSYDEAILGGVFTPVAEASAGDLSSGSMQVSFDLTDPQVSAAADQAMAAMQRGDVAGAAAAMNGVLDRAQIIVQQESGTTASAGFDAKVVSGSVTVETRAVTSTFVKPPGGAFYEVK